MSEKQTDRPNINKTVHPPIVAMGFIIVGLILGRLVPALAGMNATLKNIGLGLTFIGFLCGVGAFIEFRKARTTLDPHGSVKALVQSGIYRFTRNPIYLGFLFMVIGFPLAYGSLWGLVVSPLFMATLSKLVIEKEEAYLLPLVAQVRAAGIRTELYPESAKMKKQMSYADTKKIPYVAIVGETEMAEGKINVKNMITGEQQLLTVDELIELF